MQTDTELQWLDDSIAAFEQAKAALADATLLSHPKPDTVVAIMSDALDIAVGAVLQQVADGQWQPVGYFSRKLSPTERRYSTYDRELLAMYLSVKHFRYFIEGRSFSLYTDHKPFTFSMSTKFEWLSPRQVRHLDFIVQYITDIRFTNGTNNLVADALSRVELESSSSYIIDLEAMASAQHNCEFLTHDTPHLSLSLQHFSLLHLSNTIICDVSTGQPRLAVPPAFRQSFFTLYILYPTRVFDHPKSWWHLVLCGQKCGQILSIGFIHVWHISCRR